MNKKGFTLIELMAVIIVIGIISLIVIPTINETLNNQKKELYEKQVDTIEKAAESWSLENSDKIPEDSSTVCVEIDELKQKGFLKNTDLKNPMTNKIMNGCVNISFDLSSNQYIYEYVDDGLEL